MHRDYASEIKTFKDPDSGVPLRQLTDYRGHSNHAYFTHPNWVDGGRALILFSDRENATELCRLDLESGVLTVLTDTRALDADGEVSCNHMHVNPRRPEACTWVGRRLFALGLTDGAARPLFTVPDGFRGGLLSLTADGRYVCFATTEDPQKYYGSRKLTKSERRQALLAAKPLSRIYKVSVEGGKAEVVHEERYLIGHVNTSPTRPEMLSFCHEGPWSQVDQRIWGLNVETGKSWPIRIRDKFHCAPIGHEYWMADGERLGFHGHPCPDPRTESDLLTGTLGCIRYDNSEHRELRVPGPRATGHTHSLDFTRIVGDGGGVLQLWETDGTAISGPRLLCTHDTVTRFQRFHAHPSFSPDGRQVLFSSVQTGYCQVYLVDVPADLATLPEADTRLPS